MSTRPYPDFEATEHTFGDTTRTVFRKGTGPAVLVIHEIPGLHPQVAEFARRVVDAGFTVFMPSLFGTAGKKFSIGGSIVQIAKTCVAKEFTALATRTNSPITQWLRDLGRHAHAECGGPGIGAIGMCFTGGFALAMMADPRMLAPVLCQPSVPFPLTRRQRRDLGIDDETLATVKERARKGACVMGLRFTGDWMAPPERFARLREELGDAFMAIEIDSSPGNPHGIGRLAHSVLTVDLVEQPEHPTVVARNDVLDFFARQLGTTPKEATS